MQEKLSFLPSQAGHYGAKAFAPGDQVIATDQYGNSRTEEVLMVDEEFDTVITIFGQNGRYERSRWEGMMRCRLQYPKDKNLWSDNQKQSYLQISQAIEIESAKSKQDWKREYLRNQIRIVSRFTLAVLLGFYLGVIWSDFQHDFSREKIQDVKRI